MTAASAKVSAEGDFQRIFHTQNCFKVSTLNISLNIGGGSAAQNCVNGGNGCFGAALADYCTVSACFVVKAKRCVVTVCSKLPKLKVFHICAMQL